MDKTNLREELKSLRHKTGMSQKDFAKEFGIPKRTIESWEMGKTSPRQYNYEYLKEHVERWIEQNNEERSP